MIDYMIIIFIILNNHYFFYFKIWSNYVKLFTKKQIAISQLYIYNQLNNY